ncbi:MAG: hypothetical protein ACJAS9_003967 [Polaribacter sp.]|jgi:hypothetical protein
MANQVKINIKASVEVTHTDFEVVVKNNDGKLGTLLISKRNIEWMPKGNYVNKLRLSWSRFSDFMEENRRPAKKIMG